jgi:hypothetical protein
MKKDTGVLLSEARGPLQKLIENLSGKNGSYWLDALTKMLRQEEAPKPPSEVVTQLKSVDSRTRANEALEKLAEYVRAIPCVHEVYICNEQEGGDLLNIGVYPNLMTFVHGETTGDDETFTLRINQKVILIGNTPSSRETDAMFEKWYKKEYENIDVFCKALFELCRMYEESVPQIPA